MTPLQTLLPTLETIAATDVRAPDQPMAVALQEAHDLQIALDVDDGWDRLLAVGLDPEIGDQLSMAVMAARQAQSQWVVVRERSKPQAQREREQQGASLRRELLAACRFNLRDAPQAKAVLDAIAQGDGVPDLVQDLLDLAALIDSHSPRFDLDETFDASAQAEMARSLATMITEGLSHNRARVTQHEAKLLRDRAYTYLDSVVTEIRSAGRYAFRNDPQRAAVFASDYLRRRRATARRRRAAQAAEQTAVDPMAVAS